MAFPYTFRDYVSSQWPSFVSVDGDGWFGTHTVTGSWMLVLICAVVQLGTFYVSHLWAFDKFQCLRLVDGSDIAEHTDYLLKLETWIAGDVQASHDGALNVQSRFKLELIASQYSYMLSMPLLFVFSLGFTIIKYQEGLVFVEGLGGE